MFLIKAKRFESPIQDDTSIKTISIFVWNNERLLSGLGASSISYCGEKGA